MDISSQLQVELIDVFQFLSQTSKTFLSITVISEIQVSQCFVVFQVLR